MADFSVSAIPGEPATEPDTPFIEVEGTETLLQRILRTLKDASGMWAIADQAVVSIGNFATNIFLGRILAQEVYGIYGALLETMLWVISLQAALIVYPMSVKGAVIDDPKQLKRFASANLILTAFMAIPLGLLVFLAAGAVDSIGFQIALWAGVALALWHLQEAFRRLLFSRLQFKQAILGDALRYLGQAVLIIALYLMGQLTLWTAFAAIAAGAIAGSVVQGMQIGLARVDWGEVRAMASEFWRLGRWMLAANVTLLVSTLGVQYTLAFARGWDAYGAFMALSNIVKLSHPLMFGIVSVITPAAARAVADGGHRLARSVSVRFAAQGLMILLPFYLVLLLVPRLAIYAAYGRETPYVGLESELRVYVLWYVVLYTASVLGAYLNGLERARHHFQAQLVHAIGAIVIALPLTYLYGLMGLLIGGVLAKVILCGAFMYYLRRA